MANIRFQIRIPEELHKHLAEAAEAKSQSLNKTVELAIRGGINEEYTNPFEAILEKLENLEKELAEIRARLDALEK